MFKSKGPEKDQDAAANVAEVVGRTLQQQHSVVEQPPARREPTTKTGTGSCIGSGMSIVGNIECNGPAQVFGRIKGELRASDLLIGDGAQIEGSVIAESAAASRAPSVPSASSCRTVVRSRVTFFIGRCRSTRTLCSKDRHGELKIQRTLRRSTPKTRRKRTCGARPLSRICSALKRRDPLSGLSRRLSRSIRARIQDQRLRRPGGCALRCRSAVVRSP
jgi:hypothetical protein